MTTDPYGELARSVDQLRKAVDQWRDELVRKDVFDQVLRNITDRFKDMEKDIVEIRDTMRQQGEDRKQDRRLLIATFIGPLLMLLIGAYIALQVGGSPT